uniref:Cl3204_1 n=1 Tax=Arundo donax TaxID=35708 RepID=A0A0A9E9I3_ARUDO
MSINFGSKKLAPNS